MKILKKWLNDFEKYLDRRQKAYALLPYMRSPHLADWAIDRSFVRMLMDIIKQQELKADNSRDKSNES